MWSHRPGNSDNGLLVNFLNTCLCVCVCYHSYVSLEDLFDELVFGGVNQLNDVAIQSVPVLLQETCRTHTSQHLRNIKGLNIANLTLLHLFVSGDYNVFVEV